MVVGSTVGVYLADRYGRKKSLGLAALILIITPLLLTFIRDYWLVFVVRLIQGFSEGLCSCVGPLYVTETVRAKYRGRVGSLYQLFICFGLALGYLVNLIFANGKYDENKKLDNWQWSVQYGLGTIIGVVLLITLFWTKETDIWLMKQDPVKRGMVDKEKSRRASMSSENKIPLKEKAKFYAIGGTLGAIAQLSGINAIMFYSNSFLSEVGMDNPLLATFLVAGLWNFASVIIIMPFLDKFKRRTLMIGTYAGLTVGNLLIGVSFSAGVSGLSIVGIILFLFMFECGPGCLFWVIASEVFPTPIRDSGMSFSVTVDNAANIAVTFLFPILNKAIGGDACFYIFAGICAFGTFFCLFCLPESSGELDQNILDKEEKEFAAEADKIVKSKTKGVHVDV